MISMATPHSPCNDGFTIHFARKIIKQGNHATFIDKRCQRNFDNETCKKEENNERCVEANLLQA